MAYEVLVIAFIGVLAAVLGFFFRNRSVGDLLVPSSTLRLRQEIISLTRQAEAVNSPATFAQHAKIMREVNKRKAQLEQTPDSGHPVLKLIKVDIALRSLSIIFILLYWGRPKVAAIPADMLYPVMKALSTVLWFVVCYSVFKRLMEFASSLVRPAAKKTA